MTVGEYNDGALVENRMSQPTLFIFERTDGMIECVSIHNTKEELWA